MIQQFRKVRSKPQDTFLKTVGLNIRNIRNAKGLSMESVANEAEIEYRQLGRIERGEVNATVLSLLKIATVLEVNVGDFFAS